MRRMMKSVMEIMAGLYQVVEGVAVRRTNLFFVLRIGVTASIFAVIFSMIDLGAVLDVVASAAWGMLALAFGLLSMVPVLTALRWRLSCKLTSNALRYREHLGMQVMSSFVGQVLPSYVGGEGVRVLLFGKKCGSYITAAAGVITDRLFGVVALIVIFFMTVPVHGLVSMNGAGRSALAMTTVFASVLSVLLILVALPVGLRVFSLRSLQRFQDIGNALKRVWEAPTLSMRILAVAFAIHITSLVTIGVLFHALGERISVLELVVVFPAVFFALMIPVSISGWGLREGVFALFFGFVGVPVVTSLAVSVLFGLAMILVSLPGGLLMLRMGMPHQEKLEQARETSPNSEQL